MEALKNIFSKKNLRRILRYVLILSMIATISFMFYQSLKSQEKSAETSEKVEQIIEPILPSDTPVGGYVQDNIRKIAHFIEFFLLGAELSLFVLLFHRKRLFVVGSYMIAVVVALLDETIQIFSDRGSSVADVWLDVLGFVTAATVVYVIGFLYLHFKRTPADKTSEINGDA